MDTFKTLFRRTLYEMLSQARAVHHARERKLLAEIRRLRGSLATRSPVDHRATTKTTQNMEAVR